MPAEVGEEYRRAYDAGATIGHVHGRKPDGTPTQDLETFRAYSSAIRERCPIIQQFSTGGAVGMGVEERIAALELKPDMATLTLGTCNFGDDIFENSLPTIRTILDAHPAVRRSFRSSRSSTTACSRRRTSSSRRAF